MRKLLLLLVVFGALPLFGQGTSFPVFNRQGWTMAGAVVGTCNGPADPGTSTLYCSSPVVTYTDWTLAVPCTNVTTIPNPPGPPLGPTKGVGCTNPGLTDSHGNATIFAANGFYWALISGYQVVPQTFPFDIGAGGGGGGSCPAGASNDVQFNENNACAVDTGIFTHNTTLHVTYDNEFSANNELQVSDPTTTGVLSMGHSNGTSTDFSFLLSLTPTFGATYGLCPPDAVPTGANYHWSISSGTPTTLPNGNSCYPAAWVADGTGAAISAESFWPLDTSNIPSPTTGADFIRTPIAWAPSQYLKTNSTGGQYGSLTNSAVTNDDGALTNAMIVILPNPYKKGDALVFGGSADDTVTGVSDSCGNTWTHVSARNWWYAVNAVACATPDVITGTLASTTGWAALGAEVFGAGVVDVLAQSNDTPSGSTCTMTPVVTTQPDVLVALTAAHGAAGVGYQYDTPGTGFITPAPSQTAVYGGSGLGTSRYVYMQYGPAATVGSQSAIYQYHGFTGGVPSCSTDGVTIAFKPSVANNPQDPAPGYIQYLDMAGTGGDFSPLAQGNVWIWNGAKMIPLSFSTGLTLTTSDPTTYTLTAGGTGVTSFTGDGVLLDNSASTGAVTAHAKTFTADNIYGNFTAGTATPSTQAIPSCAADGSHSLTYASHTLTCTAVGAAGSVPFSGLTTSSNTTATMTIDSGATMTVSGTGVNNANQVNGAVVPTSATVTATNASKQIIAATVQGNGTKVQLSTSTTTTNDCVKFDANGNTVDSGAACGSAVTVCSGTITFNPGATSSNTCSAAATGSCSGLLTTDNVLVDFNADPTAITGYTPGSMGTIVKYPTANTVNVKFCNNTGSSITPTSVTLNFRAVR